MSYDGNDKIKAYVPYSVHFEANLNTTHALDRQKMLESTNSEIKINLGKDERNNMLLAWISYQNPKGAKYANPVSMNQSHEGFKAELRANYYAIRDRMPQNPVDGKRHAA